MGGPASCSCPRAEYSSPQLAARAKTSHGPPDRRGECHFKDSGCANPCPKEASFMRANPSTRSTLNWLNSEHQMPHQGKALQQFEVSAPATNRPCVAAASGAHRQAALSEKIGVTSMSAWWCRASLARILAASVNQRQIRLVPNMG